MSLQCSWYLSIVFLQKIGAVACSVPKEEKLTDTFSMLINYRKTAKAMQYVHNIDVVLKVKNNLLKMNEDLGKR